MPVRNSKYWCSIGYCRPTNQVSKPDNGCSDCFKELWDAEDYYKHTRQMKRKFMMQKAPKKKGKGNKKDGEE